MSTLDLYLLDTNGLMGWSSQTVTPEFQEFLDLKCLEKKLLVSIGVYWEMGMLIKKGRIQISSLWDYRKNILQNTNLQESPFTTEDMIHSVELPDYHKDPFDRLFIAQANRLQARLVTKDQLISQY